MNNRLIYLKWIFGIVTLVYAVFTAIYIIQIPAGRGDELLFISDLDFINQNGWIEAIKKNISIPYMLLVYPLTFLFQKHIALRVVSLLLTLIMMVYFQRRNHFSKTFIVLMLFYFCTTIFFFYGTNDTLFNVCLIVFLGEVTFLYEKEKFNSALAFSALIIAFFTRALALVYIPVLIFALYLVYKKRGQFKLKPIVPLVVLIILLVMNIPSLKAHKRLSYDLKSPPQSVSTTWGQRQYLAQLLINEGKLEKGSHPTWEETDEYLALHGEEALPKSIMDALILDFGLTTKEFFKDFLNTLVLGFRQLGGILILIFMWPVVSLLKRKRLGFDSFVPISVILMIGVFSLIIISNVELRWLAPLFVMSIVWFSNLEHKEKLPDTYLVVNYLIFIALAGYGGFRMYNKIM